MLNTAPRRASLTCKLKRRARALRFSTIGILRPRILTSMVSPRARLSLLSICTLPTTGPPPDSAADTLAQALRGALASALGSSSEEPRDQAASVLVRPRETRDFRSYFSAEARSVEHAVMADARLHMVLPLVVRKILAQSLCSMGLADAGDIVSLSLHGHQRRLLDLGWVYQSVPVGHHAPRKPMLKEDGFDGLQVILGGQIHYREKLIVKFAVFIGGIAVSSDEIMKKIAVRRDVAIKIHPHEAAELQKSRVNV